jgi:hypothetical protein
LPGASSLPTGSLSTTLNGALNSLLTLPAQLPK